METFYKSIALDRENIQLKLIYYHFHQFPLISLFWKVTHWSEILQFLSNAQKFVHCGIFGSIFSNHSLGPCCKEGYTFHCCPTESRCNCSTLVQRRRKQHHNSIISCRKQWWAERCVELYWVIKSTVNRLDYEPKVS